MINEAYSEDKHICLISLPVNIGSLSFVVQLKSHFFVDCSDLAEAILPTITLSQIWTEHSRRFPLDCNTGKLPVSWSVRHTVRRLFYMCKSLAIMLEKLAFVPSTALPHALYCVIKCK